MWSVIFAILAGSVPLSVLHWYLARVERRPVPKRQLGEISISSLPTQLRQYKIYVIMPAYIAGLGCMAFFWSIWRYYHTHQTRNDLIEIFPILLVSFLMILVGALWFLWAIVQRITITKASITYSYGIGQTKADLIDVHGFTERPSFIFIHFKDARKKFGYSDLFSRYRCISEGIG